MKGTFMHPFICSHTNQNVKKKGERKRSKITAQMQTEEGGLDERQQGGEKEAVDISGRACAVVKVILHCMTVT